MNKVDKIRLIGIEKFRSVKYAISKRPQLTNYMSNFFIKRKLLHIDTHVVVQVYQ